MKEYIISISVATITASLADIIAPENWRKYIRIMLGFLILSVLISPIAKLKNIEIPQIEPTNSESETTLNNTIQKEFEKNIAEDIKTRVKDEFGADITATVYVTLNEKEKISGVNKITISGKRISENIVNRLKEVYGCEDIQIKHK